MKNRTSHYLGWALTAIAVLFLLLDAGMKLAGASVSVEATVALGFDESQVRLLGAILLLATLAYAVPRTSVLGAILVTGFLGGAIAINVQHHTPLVSHTLFGVYLAFFVWGGLFLRSPALRALVPLIRSDASLS